MRNGIESLSGPNLLAGLRAIAGERVCATYAIVARRERQFYGNILLGKGGFIELSGVAR